VGNHVRIKREVTFDDVCIFQEVVGEEDIVHPAAVAIDVGASERAGDITIVVDGSYALNVAPLDALVNLPSLLRDATGDGCIRQMVSVEGSFFPYMLHADRWYD
jgi:hypothetical protein